MPDSDPQLMSFIRAIVGGDAERCAMLLAESAGLAKASFKEGATRSSEKTYFFAEIGRYIYAGDTALHIAAAAHEPAIVAQLICAGADVLARNRFGYNPLHYAAAGNPNAPRWNPHRQATTIRALTSAGIDPGTTDKKGVTPLHIAVRTRCSLAVQTLLDCGADPSQRNNSGSDSLVLAVNNTGRGGSGTAAAKREQQLILQILQRPHA